MLTRSSRFLALALAALLCLAGCVPLDRVPAADPTLPAPGLTPVSSERLVFSAAALAQPVPLGSSLYRVGSIDVHREGAFSQTLDVVMDEPNAEWITLPLRQDDLNFDGHPDLIITQPVGAKWGRLHAWLDDPDTGRFITNTLTAELGQLRVGDFRPDPDRQVLLIFNSLGMTPFENAYGTGDGYLMPAFPPPGPVDAGACPAKAPGMLLLREDGHDYCLLYPEGFEATWPNEEEVVIGEPGSGQRSPGLYPRERAGREDGGAGGRRAAGAFRGFGLLPDPPQPRHPRRRAGGDPGWTARAGDQPRSAGGARRPFVRDDVRAGGSHG